MKANELRIGNIVDFCEEGNTIVVAAVNGCPGDDHELISFRHINEPEFVYDRFLEECIPIPITEEWLIRAGFKVVESDEGVNFSWEKNTMQIDWEPAMSHNTYFLCTNQAIQAKPIQYIHELQNLYFALMGEELHFKEV